MIEEQERIKEEAEKIANAKQELGFAHKLLLTSPPLYLVVSVITGFIRAIVFVAGIHFALKWFPITIHTIGGI